jgi:hypothetical protein
MAKQGNKARLNITVDPHIYEAARRRFPALGLSMSAFVESQLALFLQATEPMAEILESGTSMQTTEARTAVRAFFVRSAATVAQGTATVTHLHRDFEESHTDKK